MTLRQIQSRLQHGQILLGGFHRIGINARESGIVFARAGEGRTLPGGGILHKADLMGIKRRDELGRDTVGIEKPDQIGTRVQKSVAVPVDVGLKRHEPGVGHRQQRGEGVQIQAVVLGKHPPVTGGSYGEQRVQLFGSQSEIIAADGFHHENGHAIVFQGKLRIVGRGKAAHRDGASADGRRLPDGERGDVGSGVAAKAGLPFGANRKQHAVDRAKTQ